MLPTLGNNSSSVVSANSLIHKKGAGKNLQSLPDEILTFTADYLEKKDYKTARLVNSKFRNCLSPFSVSLQRLVKTHSEGGSIPSLRELRVEEGDSLRTWIAKVSDNYSLSMRYLNLEQLENINAFLEDLRQLGGENSNLESLNLRGTGISLTDALSLLACFPSVNQVDLCHYGINRNLEEIIDGALPSFPRVTYLNLSDRVLDFATLKKVFNVFPNLRTLDLSSCYRLHESLWADDMALNLRDLRDLRIGFCFLSERVVERNYYVDNLRIILANCKQLKKLSLYAWIDVNGDDATDDDNNDDDNFFREVDFEWINSNANTLAELVAVLPVLEELDLSLFFLNSDSVSVINPNVCWQLLQLPKVKLNPAVANNVANILVRGNFGEQMISDEGIKGFEKIGRIDLRGAVNWPNLEVLSRCYPNVTVFAFDSGVISTGNLDVIANNKDFKWLNIKELNFFETAISAPDLVSMLKCFPGVVRFKLSNLKDIDWDYLFFNEELMDFWANLEELDLSCIAINFDHLNKLLPKCLKLKKLKSEKCFDDFNQDNFSDDMLKVLSNLEELKLIYFQRCEDVLRKLMLAGKNLKKLTLLDGPFACGNYEDMSLFLDLVDEPIKAALIGLEELSLEKSLVKDLEMLQRLFKTISNLKLLKINLNKHQELLAELIINGQFDLLEKISGSIEYLENVYALDLEHKEFTFQSLFELWSYCKKAYSFKLSFSKILPLEDFTDLPEDKQRVFWNLKSLDLTGTDITIFDLKMLLDCCKNLKSLTLASCRNIDIDSLDVIFASRPFVEGKLKVLDLSYTNINFNDIERLDAIVKLKAPKLRYLVLKHFLSFVDSLAGGQLNGDTYFIATPRFCERLADFTDRNINISRLNIVLSWSHSVKKILTFLDLSHAQACFNDIDRSNGVVKFETPPLRYLTVDSLLPILPLFAFNKSNDGAPFIEISHFYKSLANLTKLNIGCYIHRYDVLANVLKHALNLEVLSLSFNQDLQEVNILLQDEVKASLGRLKELCLSDSFLSVRDLKEILVNYSGLTKLNLSSCYGITWQELDLSDLPVPLQNLTVLDLSFTGVTVEALNFFLANCPNLKTLELRDWHDKCLVSIAGGKVASSFRGLISNDVDIFLRKDKPTLKIFYGKNDLSFFELLRNSFKNCNSSPP